MELQASDPSASDPSASDPSASDPFLTLPAGRRLAAAAGQK
jgi:hypothetical protein